MGVYWIRRDEYLRTWHVEDVQWFSLIIHYGLNVIDNNYSYRLAA